MESSPFMLRATFGLAGAATVLFALVGCGSLSGDAPTSPATSALNEQLLSTETRMPTSEPHNTPTSTQSPDYLTRLVSQTATGQPISNAVMDDFEVSGDGRTMVATLFIQNESQSEAQIYLYDLASSASTLISAAPDGTPGNNISTAPSISADGSVVAFFSFATNLAEDAGQDCLEIAPGALCGSLYLYHIAGAEMKRVSVGASWPGAGLDTALSADGRYVAFVSSWAVIREGVFLYDRITGEVITITEGDTSDPNNPGALLADISGDGRFVVFASNEAGLTPGDTNGTFDVFVYNRDTQAMIRASTPADGVESGAPSGALLAGENTQATVGGAVSISEDGRYVTFFSSARNLTSETVPSGGVYLYDRDSDHMELISVANDGKTPLRGGGGSISGDGRYVVFTSVASEFIEGCPENGVCPSQVYVRDRVLARTYLVSQGLDGEPGDDASIRPIISANGRYVIYLSRADNLTAVGEVETWNVFITDLFLLLGLQN